MMILIQIPLFVQFRRFSQLSRYIWIVCYPIGLIFLLSTLSYLILYMAVWFVQKLCGLPVLLVPLVWMFMVKDDLVSSELCVAIALFAKQVCATHVSSEILSPFVTCWLIALHKNPGVRPSGVCEVVRRIMAKAVLFSLGKTLNW